MFPKISVVIPVYNTEKYIDKCIRSVINQPVEALEIIIVDNGCTDRSPELIRNYSKLDSRIRVIQCEHGEVFHARNLALETASGEWIAFCDSDDTLAEDAFSVPLKVGEKTGCDIVTASFNEVKDSGVITRISIDQRPKDPFSHLFSTPCVWNKLIRNDFLKTNSLTFPELIMGEDVAFLGKVLRALPKTAVADSVMYNYWLHQNSSNPSMTHRYTLQFFDLHIECRRALQSILNGTAYENRCREYIHLEMVYFLIVFLRKIREGDQRLEAFERFRRFVMEFDWKQYPGRFESIFGLGLEMFASIDCDDFLYEGNIIPARDIVLREYKNGLIGMRYIVKYLSAWLDFKLKHGN